MDGQHLLLGLRVHIKLEQNVLESVFGGESHKPTAHEKPWPVGNEISPAEYSSFVIVIHRRFDFTKSEAAPLGAGRQKSLYACGIFFRGLQNGGPMGGHRGDFWSYRIRLLFRLIYAYRPDGRNR